MEEFSTGSQRASRIPHPTRQRSFESRVRAETPKDHCHECKTEDKDPNSIRNKRFITPEEQETLDWKSVLAEASSGHALNQGCRLNQASKMRSRENIPSGPASIRGKVAGLKERAGSNSLKPPERYSSVAIETNSNVSTRISSVRQQAPEKRSSSQIWTPNYNEVADAPRGSQSLRGRSNDVGAGGVGRPDSRSTNIPKPHMRKSDVRSSTLGESDGQEHVSPASKWRGKLDTLKDYLHASPPRGIPRPKATGSPAVIKKLTTSPLTVENRRPTATEIPDTDNFKENLEDTPKRPENVQTPVSGGTPASLGLMVIEVLEEVTGWKPTLIDVVTASRVESPLVPLRGSTIYDKIKSSRRASPTLDRSQSALARYSGGRLRIEKSSSLQNGIAAQPDVKEFVAGPEYQDHRAVMKSKSLQALPKAHASTTCSITLPRQGPRILQSRVADARGKRHDIEQKSVVATNQTQCSNGGKFRTQHGRGQVEEMAYRSSQMREGIKAIKTSQNPPKLSQKRSSNLPKATRVREQERSFTTLPSTDNIFDADAGQDVPRGNAFNISIPPSVSHIGIAQDNESSPAFYEMPDDSRLNGSPVRRIRDLQLSAQKSFVSHASQPSEVSQVSLYPESPKIFEDGSRGVWGIDENGQPVEFHELPAREEVEKICTTAGTFRGMERTFSMLNVQIDRLKDDEVTQRNMKEQALIQVERLKTQIALSDPRTWDQESDLPSSPTLPSTPQPKQVENWRQRYLETTEVLKEVVDVNVTQARELEAMKKAHQLSQAEAARLEAYVEQMKAELIGMSTDMDTICRGCEKHAQLNDNLNAAIAGAASREAEVLRLREQLADNESKNEEVLKLQEAVDGSREQELLKVRQELAEKEDDHKKMFDRLVEKEQDRQRLFRKLEQINGQLEEKTKELQDMKSLLDFDEAGLAKGQDRSRAKTASRLSGGKKLWTWKQGSKGN